MFEASRHKLHAESQVARNSLVLYDSHLEALVLRSTSCGSDVHLQLFFDL